MGGREKKKKEGGKVVRASGDHDCGRPRVACGRGRWGTRSEEREEKGEGKKEGRDSRRPVTTRRVGRERDGTRIEFGRRVVQERFWNYGSGFKGSRAQRQTTFSALFNLVDFLGMLQSYPT